MHEERRELEEQLNLLSLKSLGVFCLMAASKSNSDYKGLDVTKKEKKNIEAEILLLTDQLEKIDRTQKAVFAEKEKKKQKKREKDRKKKKKKK